MRCAICHVPTTDSRLCELHLDTFRRLEFATNRIAAEQRGETVDGIKRTTNRAPRVLDRHGKEF